MIFISKYLVPKPYLGITIWPFVFLRTAVLKEHTVLINHEGIHLKQQLELLIVPFFVWYFVEFLFWFYQYKSWQLAYRNSSFEKEAYANETNFQYLNTRPFWGFLNKIQTKTEADA